MNLTTNGGYSMYDMSSLLQKAIRRGDICKASFAAKELYPKFYKYTWKRLLVISAEDCYGIMTKEIIALKAADDIVNEKRKADEKDLIFIAKAVTLLCMARKNRDACYVACNLFTPYNTCDESEIPRVDDINSLSVEHIPDWVYDCHTIKGKINGKDDLDMIKEEQLSLFPLQRSIFDEGDWREDANMCGYAGTEKYKAFSSDKKSSKQCASEYFG